MHSPLELILLNLVKDLVSAHDARIGKEHIQPSILSDGFVYDALDVCFIRGVHLARMDLHSGIHKPNLPHVRIQILVVEVADEQAAHSVCCEKMRGCAANAERRVAACIDARGKTSSADSSWLRNLFLARGNRKLEIIARLLALAFLNHWQEYRRGALVCTLLLQKWDYPTHR